MKGICKTCFNNFGFRTLKKYGGKCFQCHERDEITITGGAHPLYIDTEERHIIIPYTSPSPAEPKKRGLPPNLSPHPKSSPPHPKPPTSHPKPPTSHHHTLPPSPPSHHPKSSPPHPKPPTSHHHTLPSSPPSPPSHHPKSSPPHPNPPTSHPKPPTSHHHTLPPLPPYHHTLPPLPPYHHTLPPSPPYHHTLPPSPLSPIDNDKRECSKCTKLFTNKTLDKHDGMCGRCYSAVFGITKQNIPHGIKKEVWRRYQGNKLEGECYVCEGTICAMSFHAGHLKSEYNGGQVSVDNMRPVCRSCNSKVGVHDMDAYKRALGNIKKNKVENVGLLTRIKNWF